MTILLPTAYWGPVSYYSAMWHAQKVIIERYENYPKQTYRNRCVIYGANGPLTLTIPVSKGDALKMYTKDIRIDNSTNWQKLHLKAIESSYGCSPFFIFYMDEIRPFYEKKYDNLYDFNWECMQTMVALLDFKTVVDETTVYLTVMPDHIKDLRNTIQPKTVLNDKQFLSYRQVFEPKSGFLKNLSILDVLFNTGPEAQTYIKC